MQQATMLVRAPWYRSLQKSNYKGSPLLTGEAGRDGADAGKVLHRNHCREAANRMTQPVNKKDACSLQVLCVRSLPKWRQVPARQAAKSHIVLCMACPAAQSQPVCQGLPIITSTPHAKSSEVGNAAHNAKCPLRHDCS
jgi:hypothetical protein